MLFLALVVDLLAPRASVLASVLSPRELFGQMDRGVQQIYSEGLETLYREERVAGAVHYLTKTTC